MCQKQGKTVNFYSAIVMMQSISAYWVLFLNYLLKCRPMLQTYGLVFQGFRLDFVFEPNEYFSNSTLSKEYFYRFKVDDSNPLDYEGPEIIRCTGWVVI